MKSNVLNKLTREYQEATEKEWAILQLNDLEFQLQDTFLKLKENDSSDRINLDLTSVLRKNKNLVLLGNPGSGKSTTLQFIGLCFVHEGWNKVKFNINQEYIPVKLDLRQYAPVLSMPGPTIETAFCLVVREFLRQYNEDLISGLIETWLKEKKLLILLDGLDEVQDSLRDEVRNEIHRFSLSHHATNSKIIVSSRFAGYISLGSSFKEYSIEPFESVEEAGPLLRSWLATLRQDWSKEKAESETALLLEQMTDHRALRRIIDNPLLLRISAQVYTSTGKIADNRAKLYHQYVDDLWRRAQKRGADSNLESQVMSNIELLAWQLHTNKTPDIPLEIYKLAQEKMGVVANKINKSRFSHTTLQEYFVSKRLIRAWQANQKNTWDFLRPRLHIPEWREPILLMGGNLNQTDSNRLIKKILYTHSPMERRLHRDKILIAALVGEGAYVDINVVKKILKYVHFLSSPLGGFIVGREGLWHFDDLVKATTGFGKSAIPTLCLLLNNKDLFILDTAIDALKKLNAIEAIPNLLAILNNPPEYSVAGNSMLALGSLKAKEAVPDMLQAVSTGDPYWGDMGAYAIGMMKSIEVIPNLIQLLDVDTSRNMSDVTDTVAKALSELGTIAIPYIQEALEHKNPRVRIGAIEAVKKLNATELTSCLCKVLNDKDDVVREVAITALASMNAVVAIPDLRYILLNDDTEWVRSEAANALGVLKAEEAITDLGQALNDQSDFVRKAAANALRGMNAKKYLLKITPKSAIIGAFQVFKLHFPDSIYEPSALEKLEDRREDSIRYLCEELRNSSDVQSRWAALIALAQLNATEAIPDLRKALKDENKYVRREAIISLTNLSAEEAISELRQSLGDDDQDVQRAAISALGNLNALEAVPDLRLALKEKNLRTAAATALGKMKKVEALPYLRHAKNERNIHENYNDIFELRDLISSPPDLINKKDSTLYRNELRKLLKDKNFGEEKLILERLEQLQVADSLHQDPFMPFIQHPAWKFLKNILYFLLIIIVMVFITILSIIYGSAEDVFKGILSQTVKTWVQANVMIALLIFIGIAVIVLLLTRLVDFLRDRLGK